VALFDGLVRNLQNYVISYVILNYVNYGTNFKFNVNSQRKNSYEILYFGAFATDLFNLMMKIISQIR